MKYVLYHAGCVDGFTAAWVAHEALGDYGVTYLPVQYGQDFPAIPDGNIVYILDFSWPYPDYSGLQAFIDRMATVVILDHHVTARDGIKKLILPPSSTIVYDNNKSGAMLTFEYFFSTLEPGLLVQYVQDRDLWRWALPYSREISAAIASYDFTFAVWDWLSSSLEYEIRELKEQGEAILRYQQQLIERICRHAVNGVVNSCVLQSEVGERLIADGAAYADIWYRAANGEYIHSLRGPNVDKIALARGGGGHTSAAGYVSKEIP